MKHNLPALDGLKVFESAARLLSFSRAADELCITKAAVSYHINKLEESLDSALFRRSIRQVYLTDAGQALMQTTRRVFADLDSTITQIKPGDADSDILVGATTYVALRWLSSRITRFSERYPDITILLKHSFSSDETPISDVDVEIRWGARGSFPQKECLLEFPMELFPVCSPVLLKKLGLTTSTAISLTDPLLDQTILLCEDRPLDLWESWFNCTNVKPDADLSNPRRIIADANVRTQAAIDGQGWTLADDLMQTELNNGSLVAPFEGRLSGYGYAILSPSGRFLNQKARLFRDWITKEV